MDAYLKKKKKKQILSSQSQAKGLCDGYSYLHTLHCTFAAATVLRSSMRVSRVIPIEQWLLRPSRTPPSPQCGPKTLLEGISLLLCLSIC